MKTILVDAVNTLIIKIATNANNEQMIQFGRTKMAFDVYSLEDYE